MIFITTDQELQLHNKNVSLYFYASWMPHHTKMISMIEKIEKKYKDLIFYAIDTDYFKVLCKRFNVNSIPEIILFINNKELKRINGLILTSALKSAFVDIYNNTQPNGDNHE